MCSLALLASCDKTTNGEMPNIDKSNVEEGTPSASKQTRGQEDNNTKDDELDGHDKGCEYPQFFTAVVVPESINVTRSWGGGYLPKTTLLMVQFSGKEFEQASDSQREQFSALAAQIGDLPQKEGEGYMHYWEVPRPTLNAGVKNLTLKALTDYNDKYPAGSDLRSILRVHYRSFDHIFSSPERPREGFGKSHSQLCANGFEPIKYLDVADVLPLYFEGIGSVVKYGIGLNLELLEKASSPQARMELTVELEDGKVLRCTID